MLLIYEASWAVDVLSVTLRVTSCDIHPTACLVPHLGQNSSLLRFAVWPQ